ncbi:MAG: hypothetical protein ACYTGS_12780 [Planctomycetota bacterium]
MITESQKGELRRRFVVKAEEVFDIAMEQGIGREDITLIQIEEIVNELKFELTGMLVESVIEVQAGRRAGPGPKCEGCGREMRYKGEKRRPDIVTSQGEIEVERSYYHCEKCKSGLFPPGQAIGDQQSRVE